MRNDSFQDFDDSDDPSESSSAPTGSNSQRVPCRLEKRRAERIGLTPAPLGFEWVGYPDDLQSSFLLPRDEADAVDREFKRALARREAKASEAARRLAEGTPSAAGGATSSVSSAVQTPPKRSAYQVDPAPAIRGWPKPDGAGWTAVFDSQRLIERVARHNQAQGSSDTHDRQRDAQLLNQLLERGPWRRHAGPTDPHGALQALRAECGHLPEAVDLVAERMAWAQHAGEPLALPPVLLVGAPGVGKTHFARRLGEILQLPTHVLDATGLQTNSALQGSDRHWSNSTPGLLFDLVAMGAAPNPLMVVDEVDKVSRNERYDPLSALHAALEPSSASRTFDQSIRLEFDASHVVYLLTANTLKGLPDSLLSRLRIVYCEAPGPREGLAVAKRLAGDLVDRLEPGLGFEGFDRSVLVEVAARPPRGMSQALSTALARALRAGRRRVGLNDLAPSGLGPRSLQ